jgi:small subunit ribosomal protein S13
MARISGIDLPKNKRGEIGLTYIYGIGRSTAQKILSDSGIDLSKKVQDWDDNDLNKIRTYINDNIKVEGALRSDFRFAASAPRTTAGPVKESVRQLPTRRK